MAGALSKMKKCKRAVKDLRAGEGDFKTAERACDAARQAGAKPSTISAVWSAGLPGGLGSQRAGRKDMLGTKPQYWVWASMLPGGVIPAGSNFSEAHATAQRLNGRLEDSKGKVIADFTYKGRGLGSSDEDHNELFEMSLDMAEGDERMVMEAVAQKDCDVAFEALRHLYFHIGGAHANATSGEARRRLEAFEKRTAASIPAHFERGCLRK